MRRQLIRATITLALLAAACTPTPTPGNPGSLRVVDISSAGFTACAVISDGTVRCWGTNDSGLLGPGAPDVSLTAREVAGVSDVASVSNGRDHTCALHNDGTATCWGRNSAGQLGIGNTDITAPPTAVAGLTDIVEIDTGSQNTCAVVASGGVYCWGANFSGQIGNGTFTTSESTPQLVLGAWSDAVGVSVGTSHVCALRATGEVACWGSGGNGKLGSDVAQWAVPLDVPGISNATSIAAGSEHSCATTADGRAWCWGRNFNGQLGTGTTQSHTAPAPTTDLVAHAEITAVGSTSCSLDTNDEMWCWGSNSSRSLGVGSDDVNVLTATKVQGLGRSTVMSTGGRCALEVSGLVKCWSRSIVGDGGWSFWRFPTTVAGLPHPGGTTSTPIRPPLTGAATLTANDENTCVVMADTTTRCWGFNAGLQSPPSTPGNEITGFFAEPLVPDTGVEAVAIGEGHQCVLYSVGNVNCWGRNIEGQAGSGGGLSAYGSPQPVAGITDAVGLAAGQRFACAIVANGTVRCWGDNEFGQLGDGTLTNQFTPVAVAGIADAVAITAGWRHACVLHSDATTSCWGWNRWGSIGDGTTDDRNLAVSTPGIVDATQIVAGATHTCVLHATGTVSCWGNQVSGNYPEAQSTSPVAIAGLTAVTSLATSEFTTCALSGDHTAKCWGNNWAGQIGDGTLTDRTAPVDILESDIASLNGGNEHMCALHLDSSVSCWGSNEAGQLGDDTFGPEPSLTAATVRTHP